MPKKRQKDLVAKDLKPGLRFRYQDADVEILRAREGTQDRFGQPLDRWWSRNLGTGQEGYVSLGPAGKLYNVEPLSAAAAAKSRHHATKKKSPTQLQREIDEALVKSPSKSKSATVIVYSRPSGYWYAQARDATTGAQITDATGYSREDVLRALRGKFAMIGVTIKSVTDEDP